jgi:hypothetical protein
LFQLRHHQHQPGVGASVDFGLAQLQFLAKILTIKKLLPTSAPPTNANEEKIMMMSITPSGVKDALFSFIDASCGSSILYYEKVSKI